MVRVIEAVHLQMGLRYMDRQARDMSIAGLAAAAVLAVRAETASAQKTKERERTAWAKQV